MNIKRNLGNIIIFALFSGLLLLTYWVFHHLPNNQKPKPACDFCAQLEEAPACEAEIDYSKTLDQMIEEAGFAETTQSDLTAMFPLNGSGKVKRTLNFFHPANHGTWAELEKALNQCGYRLGTIEELIAFKTTCIKNNPGVGLIELGSLYLRPEEKLPEFAAIFNEGGGKWSLVTAWMGYDIKHPAVMYLISKK